MANNKRQRTAGQWFLKIAAGVVIGILTGLLVNWPLAFGMVLIYVVIEWAAERGLDQKRELDASREEWISNQKRGKKD
ncbi:hypothetical protein SAMN04489740_4049 [Arthrobacter alpinus]|uniref:Small integral membrane protein n=1 Tax=Arthrobacter alpinus TaxID=656366 RepID=A0A1H5PCV5_9MICC|nr:hypothetical protein [Arthrobacter alpinus]SEF10921.1 hypothetical protein SAMN04489740_4049 [Arthrobacter alpinus]